MIANQNIQNRYGLELQVIENGTELKSCTNSDTILVEIGKNIVFDPTILDTYRHDGWRPVHYDLLVVCAAVEFADRRRKRRTSQWSRQFKLKLPVFELAVWKEEKVQAHLQDTLRHLTGDNWHFDFIQAKDGVENVMHQNSLIFDDKKDFVMAYSDGLDSRCVSGLLDSTDSAIRVRMTNHKDSSQDGEKPFDRIPFTVKYVSSRESSLRSRGFKFAAITAIVSHLSEVERIVVPESGQGALGPVLLPLHNIYADYRNHPTFFRKMERFVNCLLDFPTTYEQPRLWHTKAETIRDFLANSGNIPESVLSTRSCWQQRWNVRFDGKLRQCGLCAACLLRRMSIFAAGIDEPVDTYSVSDLSAANYESAKLKIDNVNLTKTMVEYGIVGVRYLQQLGEMSKHSNEFRLQPHVHEIAQATGMSEPDVHKALMKLLHQHLDEWRNFIDAQGKNSFVLRWMN